METPLGDAEHQAHQEQPATPEKPAGSARPVLRQPRGRCAAAPADSRDGHGAEHQQAQRQQPADLATERYPKQAGDAGGATEPAMTGAARIPGVPTGAAEDGAAEN
jgi:hypothetical protein